MPHLSTTAPPAPAPPATGPAGPEPLGADLLVDIASGLAASTALVEAVARHDPLGRRPVRLLATDRYEAWVIGWTTGQRVELHDHGNSVGVIAVTEGTLTEVRAERSERGGDRGGERGGERSAQVRLVSRYLDAGSVHVVPLGAVHDVLNAGSAPATSVHVYSPPLSSMTHYDDVTLEPTRRVRVGYECPALPSPAASVLLHPSAHP